jgi:hypothetical protein
MVEELLHRRMVSTNRQYPWQDGMPDSTNIMQLQCCTYKH